MRKYIERIGEEKYNNQGCKMKIIDYFNNKKVLVQFQDEYHYKMFTSYDNFIKGKPKNPFNKNICNVGMIGDKYNIKKCKKEYEVWKHMIRRSFDDKFKNINTTYKDVTCCNEWLCFTNFYEWIYTQENFDRWSNNDDWALDKDIIIKGNKIYSPDTCCLVPQYVNTLFIKCDGLRGMNPIGTHYDPKTQRYIAQYRRKEGVSYIGRYPTPEDAFYLGYKPEKEKYIKQVAQEEYDKGNITKRCYEAMMSYEVEITD